MAIESEHWPLPGQTRTIAVANQKGGVGKTTTVVNLGAWLALQGAKVLLVDLDPQANATSGVGVDPRRATSNIYRIVIEGAPIDDAIEATAARNLYCVPATIDLAGAEIELVAVLSRELKLRRALEGLAGEFDYILIDCPPSLGLLTINGLAAASELIVPIQCEYYALEGLGQLLKNVQLVRSNLNPGLRLAGIVLTMHDKRTRLSDQVADQVRGHFTGRVYTTVIPRSVRLSEAPSFGQPIALYDPSSRGSEAYRALAFEVALQSAGKRVPALVGGGDARQEQAIETSAGDAEEPPAAASAPGMEEPGEGVVEEHPTVVKREGSASEEESSFPGLGAGAAGPLVLADEAGAVLGEPQPERRPEPPEPFEPGVARSPVKAAESHKSEEHASSIDAGANELAPPPIYGPPQEEPPEEPQTGRPGGPEPEAFDAGEPAWELDVPEFAPPDQSHQQQSQEVQE